MSVGTQIRSLSKLEMSLNMEDLTAMVSTQSTSLVNVDKEDFQLIKGREKIYSSCAYSVLNCGNSPC